jgi:hypothetical protein
LLPLVLLTQHILQLLLLLLQLLNIYLLLIKLLGHDRFNSATTNAEKNDTHHHPKKARQRMEISELRMEALSPLYDLHRRFSSNPLQDVPSRRKYNGLWDAYCVDCGSRATKVTAEAERQRFYLVRRERKHWKLEASSWLLEGQFRLVFFRCSPTITDTVGT